MDALSQEICCYRYHCSPPWLGVDREWGDIPSVPSHSSYPPYSVQTPLLGWGGGGRPSDLPSCLTHLPNTAAYSTLGPLSQVNEINFENMSNDDAVRVLREIVHKPGYVWDGHYRRGGRHFWLSGKGFGLASTHPALTRDTLAFRPITLTVAKCWDPSPRGCFTLPRSKWMGDSVLTLVPGIREPCLSCLWCCPEPSHLPCRAWH